MRALFRKPKIAIIFDCKTIYRLLLLEQKKNLGNNDIFELRKRKKVQLKSNTEDKQNVTKKGNITDSSISLIDLINLITNFSCFKGEVAQKG